MFINILGEYVSYMDRGENNAFINLVKNDASELIQLYTIDYNKYYETAENDENGMSENNEDIQEGI